MELPNSGDKMLELWDSEQGWIPFEDAYLTEATEYKLRYHGKDAIVCVQGVPLPFYKDQGILYGSMITPFQSGGLKLSVNGLVFTNYVYPDTRKLTEIQYIQMLDKILEEANSCFQMSGLTMNVDAFEKSREVTWTQWNYIDRTFHQLKTVFTRIEKMPIRRLDKQAMSMNREKVQRTNQITLSWLDRKGYGVDIPRSVETSKSVETFNIYENQVLKQQLQDLHRLLGIYEDIDSVSGGNGKLKRYKAAVNRWLNSPFLHEVKANKGSFQITQTFRKHPLYRLWYDWFDKLYNHKNQRIGFTYSIPLKETFFLYEMWAYMRIVKILRGAGYVNDTAQLFKTTKEGLFLNLSENKESMITLAGGMKLYFQRGYQYNSSPFHTYTQRMIPDIVMEGKKDVFIFDPKYRVPENLGTALGEMHKYRDGIVERDSGRKVVKEVYILTPTAEETASDVRYFGEDFHQQYKMGALSVLPGADNGGLEAKILSIMINSH